MPHTPSPPRYIGGMDNPYEPPADADPPPPESTWAQRLGLDRDDDEWSEQRRKDTWTYGLGFLGLWLLSVLMGTLR
ncbi:MAG: hypothetical protein AAGD07_24645 [Planctomycetota bacterium]